MQSNRIQFPNIALTGSLGEFAKIMAADTEVPVEFYYGAALTYFGSMCSGKLHLDIGFDVQPRLYTVLLGESSNAKKSTAMKNTVKFFEGIDSTLRPLAVYGVGSAEGLVGKLTGQTEPKVLLLYDELRTFSDKTRVQGSVLLPMVTSLYEQNHWQNATKNKTTSQAIENAHLSIIGCCTDQTYSDIWTRDTIAIGFPNRLFVVYAGKDEKVAWPKPPDPEALNTIRERIRSQIQKVSCGLKLTITEEASEWWAKWYEELEKSEHTRRLDTLGFKLMGPIAVTMDKSEIDVEVIEIVTAVLDYELLIRKLTDPIDADSNIAKMEEKIRRVLGAKGPQTNRNLRRETHVERVGIWAFEAAIRNLTNVKDVEFTDGRYALVSPDLSPSPPEEVNA